MTDIAPALTLADQLVRVRTLQAGLKLVEARLRMDLRAEMAPGDRRCGTGVVQDGKVTLSKGGEWTARVLDLDALTEWVVQHYPDNVDPVIKPWFLEDIKARSVRAGMPVAPGGELLPEGCLELVQTAPELKVFGSHDGARWVAEQWELLVAGLPAALPGGE